MGAATDNSIITIIIIVVVVVVVLKHKVNMKLIQVTFLNFN